MAEKKYPIKWEYKSHSYQIADTGDYDGYWEVTNGKDSLITKEDYEDIEKDLQAVVDLMNNTYANFTFDRGNEAALEAENRWLKNELEQLRTQPGPGWVKAGEFAYVAGDPYHAKDNKSKGAGCFDAAGNFTWGDGSVTPHHAQDDLLILDESPAEQPVVSQDAHEKEVMMQAFDKVRQIFEGREWIMEGRGSYPYNDDRYKEEVRYMYDEFDTLQKDTWKNIQSKSFEYRKAIIAEYQAEQPVREAEAVTFTDWVKHNTKGYDPIVEKWVYGENEYRYTTTELYNLFKGRPAEWLGEKEVKP